MIMKATGPLNKRRASKLDKARIKLSPQELHAYYIALISSRRLCVRDTELKAS
jgi:hypothetical protein